MHLTVAILDACEGEILKLMLLRPHLLFGCGPLMWLKALR